jgi:hypothetical protein
MEKRGINIYDAVSRMRALTKEGKEFSIAFMSCDTTREKSSGLVEVPRVKLRSGTGDEMFKNSQYIINYLNIETNIPGRFYQILLMYFNGLKIEL